MDKFLNKLERKYGRYAINNLTKIILIGYVIGYVISLFSTVTGLNLFNLITFNPYYISRGQIWRLVTWVIIPPSDLSIFTIFMILFYYWIGNSLERTWGAFRYNVYVLSGIIFSVVIMFAFYLIIAYGVYDGEICNEVGYYISMFVSTYYVNLTLFLALASCYPDVKIMLWAIIPVKVKWMAYLDVAVILYDVLTFNYKSAFPISLAKPVSVIASLLNFLLFFLTSNRFRGFSGKEMKRRAEYKRKVKDAPRITKHKCAICGRTDEDSVDLSFRFCSKCNGNYEFCQDHLFTHKHFE